MLAIGLLTRPVALLLFIEMVVIVFAVHLSQELASSPDKGNAPPVGRGKLACVRKDDCWARLVLTRTIAGTNRSQFPSSRLFRQV